MFVLGYGENKKSFNFLYGSLEEKKQKLIYFLYNIFNEIVLEKNYFNSVGYYLNYNGNTQTTFALNPFYVSEDILEYLLDIIVTNEDYMNLRGIVINYSMSHTQFKNFYFYTSLIFEINGGMIFSYRKISEIYQVDSYYDMKEREYLYDFILIDLIRFIVCIGLGLIFLRDWWETLYKRYKRITNENLLFNLTFIQDATIIIFFIYRYSIKLYYSYIKIDYEKMIKFEDVIYENSFFTKQMYFELYEKKVFFIEDRLCDILLFFFSFIKSVSFVYKIQKIGNFLTFLKSASKRIFLFFFFYSFFFFCFCVVFHNLFGEKQKNLQNLEETLSMILLFCNGHNNFIQNRSLFNVSEIIMIIFLFLLIVYFLNSLFFSIFIESFRIKSMENGYLYQSNKNIFKNHLKKEEKKLNIASN